MARYSGKIGYAETKESDPVNQPGVWTEVITERQCYGDVTRNNRKLQNGESTNDNVNISNTFSIVADAYAQQHFFAIRYICWMGAKWSVTNVQVNAPRLILTVGGLYNGAQD